MQEYTVTETPSSTEKVARSAGRVRVNQGLLRPLEKKALDWLVVRLPQWVLPDHLTALGLITALVMAVAYILTHKSLHWLWVVNLGLVIHWFADSLDGTLARVRHLQRKKHGFFVDHFSDAVTAMLLFIGMGLSPLLRLDIAFLALAAYYAQMVLTYLKALVTDYFEISMGFFGPTEARVLLIILNTIIWLGHNPMVRILGYAWSILDVVGLLLGTCTLLAFLIRGEIERRKLARIDPLPRRPEA